MESETSIAEDASATSLPFVESIMRTESEEIKFPQKNGNDQNFKHLLTEETRPADRGNTGEVSEPRQEEIYQESSKACAESEKKAEHQPEGLAMMKIIPKSSVSEDEAEETLPSTASVSDEVVEKSIQQEIHDKEELIMTNVNEEQKPEIHLDEKKEVPEESAYQNSDEKESKAEPQLEAQNKEIIYTNQANLEGDEPDKINRCNDTDEEKVQISHSGEKIVPEDDGKIKQEEATEIEEETKMQILKTESESVPEDEAQETLPSTASVSGETVEKSIHQEIQDEGELAETNTNEGHKPEIHLDDKKEVPEESTYQTSEENEMKAEPQSEAQNQETTFTMKPKIQGNATDTNNKSNDTEENKVPDSHSREKFIPEDEGKFKQEEATETEEATKKQILKTESESVPKDEAQDTLPSTASVSDETVETSSHEEIHGEKEIADTNTDKDQLNEIDLDEKRVFCQHESAYKTSEEKKLKAESQLEVQNQETIQTNQPNSEGNAPETINRSNDIDEENFPISHSRENIEPEDEGRFKQEEATETEDANEIESVPKDEAQDTLPSTASVSDETVQTSNHEEIHDEMELADTNTNEGQIHEIDLDEKKEVSEESAYQTSEEKELKAEPQLEIQNKETILTNQVNSEGNAPVTINQRNHIEEGNVPVSHSGENIEPEDDGKFKQEEATETGDGTKIESVPKVEAKETLPSTASVSDETVETSKHEETHDEKELAGTDTNEGQKHEIDLDDKKEVSEESAYQTSEEKELKAEPQLEVQNKETILTNQVNSEGNAPVTINQSNDIEEGNVPVSHSGENIEPEDDGKFKQQEATETGDGTKIESVPKDEAKETLPTTASVSDETVETSKHEETHDEKELADTDTNEGQKHEIDLDDKKEVSEESAYQTSEEKELKAEPQLEVQNRETILTNKVNSEANAPETINQSNDIEEGNVPVSHSIENIEPEDDGKFKQEEATQKEDATKIESVPKDEGKETLPSTASVSNETVETSRHEETHDEKELADTDTNESQKYEIGLDNKTEVSEESAYQISEEKELKAEPQLEVQNKETILTNQENSEGNASEIINQSNYIEEGNVPVSHSGENIEPEDDGKFKEDEATETEDATKIESVPKDEAQDTLPITASVCDETFETSKQEETHDEEELADTKTNKSQKHEIDLDEKKEGFEESAYQPSEEKDLKAEPQLEVPNQETILTNQEISEGNAPETINQSNDIEEENVPVSHSGENIEPEDDGKFKQVEATETGDATKIESTGVPKDEAKETLPSTASVSGEIVETSKHEETHDEKELQDTDTNEGQKQEIDHDEKKEVSEVFGQQKSAYQTSEEKELEAEAQLEVQNQETILTNQENSEGNAPETINQSNDIKEENVPVSHDIENIEPEDDGKFKQEEATETGDATKIENVPKDEAKETLPSTASVSDETVETSKYEETHDEKELADTYINEGQKHEIDLDDKKELSEESAYQTSEEKELKAEPQLEVQNKETILTSQENSEGNAPETKNKSNDIEEGNIPVSHSGENIEPEDVGKFKQEEATETEDATKIESVPKDEAQDTLPGTASVSDETVETSKQEETHDEEELADTDTNEGQKHEIDLDEKTEGFEESAYQTSVENELKAEPKLEVQNQETILTNQENSEGNAQETINQSNDIEEENVLVSHSGGNIEPEDDEKFKQEEATETEDATKIESVHKDEAKDTLPCTASVGNETVETSNHEEIHDEKEFAETTTNEGPILEIDLDEKKEVSEVFDEHETAYQTSEENEEKVLKAEPQLEVQNQETILKNHANAEGNAPETVNQSNDNNLVSHSRENIEPEDDGKFKQEEATETEDATKIESNETVETSNHEEIRDEKDLAEKNTNEGQIQEIDLDEKKEVSEESAYQKSEEKEEIELKVEPQLEVQNQETILTNRGNSEGNAPETLNQSSDTKEENVPVSHSGENIEPEDEGKFNQEEATETEDATQRQSVPKDEAIPRTASVRNETVETSNHEEIHDEKELADTNTNEGQIHETDLNEKKEVSEESTYQTNEEKELKAERQLEVQNQETILTNKENSEGNAPEKINQSNDNEEENVPVSHSGENIEPEDEGKFKQEEATETEEATEIESVPKDEAIPRTASVRNETDETSNHEEIHDEKELADTNTNEGQIHETDLDEKKEVSEESTYQTSEEKELKAERQLEVQNKETIPTNKENSEGNAPEKINQSNDIEEENVPVSHSGENIEPEDEGKFKQEEATETEEASEIESVPKDEAQDTLPSTASVSDETVETSKHEQTHDEEELADTDTNEGQKHEIDLDEKKEGFEVSVQQQSAYQTSDEKELKAEPQLDVQNQETIQTNQPNLEGNAPHTINQSNDIEEENVPVSHSGVNIEPEDEGKFKQEEATKTEDATKMQKDEDQETLHSTASVSDETVEKSIHQEIHDEEELAETNANEGKKHEIHLDEKREVPQESTYQNSEENELKAAPQLEAQNQETILTNQPNLEAKARDIKNQSNDTEEQKVPVSQSREILVHEDEVKFKQEEATEIEEATKMQILTTESESVPDNKAFSTLSTIVSARDEPFEKSIRVEIHEETEFAIIHTREGQRPENELEENVKVLEAFDPHTVIGYTCPENEKKAAAQTEAQRMETMIIKHLNLEGMETAEISSINDTKQLEKEHKVAKPGGVSELLSVDITRECSNEEISNLSMLSDQNANNSTFDVNKISAHDYCKLDSEKEKKMFIAACGCTATSTHKNSESIEGQQDSEKTSEDNLTGVAKERVTTELETEKSSHEQKITDDTAAEKIVKAADTNGNLKLAPDSMDIEKSDKKNSVDATMYKADGTSTDDEKGEKVRNSLISNVAEKVEEKLDPDSQSGVHESTEMDKSELLVEKIPEPPYPCKKLESYVDSEAHNRTNDKHSQTKEKSNNILDQISESDGHIQGRKFQCEHQIKPKPQMEGKHHFSIPLNAKPFSMASLITEVHDGVERAGGSENIEEQTTYSEKSLSEVQILFPREETVNQVKDHDINNYKATESEQRVITDLSSENDPIKKETTSRDPDEVVEQASTGKPETQEAEITQEGSAKEKGDEFEKISPSSSGGTAMIKGSRDTDMKASHKKSHGILSGVGSKVKHSISKVKKAITGKSSHPKTPSPK
ncbi:hypothetical protein SESBI_20630 [Sesbania bispinosa]|nr:hypothetical protein SESBI_20630 [Sesbania bispinosa]